MSAGAPKDLMRQKVADYVLEHGLADLSLRPLAKELGTSTRMLLYHFESKDRLVVAALEEARARLEQLVARWMAEQDRRSPEEVVDRFWAWLCDPQQEPFIRLFFEVYCLALQDPGRFPGYAEGAAREWIRTFERLLERAGVEEDRATLATVLVAAHRGLLLDLLGTGDRARVDEAQRVLMDALGRRAPRLSG